VIRFSCRAVKNSKHGLFFVSKGAYGQIFVALSFNIFLPEFECIFAKRELVISSLFDTVPEDCDELKFTVTCSPRLWLLYLYMNAVTLRLKMPFFVVGPWTVC